MKKLILILAIAGIASCRISTGKEKHDKVTNYVMDNTTIIIYDSCEYISYELGMNDALFTHKGNCKFCQQRLKNNK